jgi:hypothetical protein
MKFNNLLFLFFLFSISIIFVSSALAISDGMELWVKMPSGSTSEVKECPGSIGTNFDCIQSYYDCSQLGVYQGDAKTYFSSTLYSESDWTNLYTCNGTIAATVTDASTGLPINGASVSATGPSSGSCTTDSAGQCTIYNLLAGTYSATASHYTHSPQTNTGLSVNGNSSTPTPVSFSLTPNPNWGCDGGAANDYCSGTENQTACPGDCKTTVSMTPNANLIVGQPAQVTIFFSDGRYLANHNVKFTLIIEDPGNPEGIVWDFNNYCQYAGVILSKDGAEGTTKWSCGSMGGGCMGGGSMASTSQDYSFTTTFTCKVPQGLTSGSHTLLVTPTIYSSPISLRAVQVQFTVAGNQTPDLSSYIASFFNAVKSFLGIK